jgi:putative sterol carrier protein
LSIRFLSDEWAQAVKDGLNANPDFAKAAAGQKAKLQQVITDGEGATRYWITIEDGKIDMGVGDVGSPDATITQSYDTAVALAKRELNPVTGFMLGKIKIDGNMGMLLGLQGALGQLPEVMGSLDVEY